MQTLSRFSGLTPVTLLCFVFPIVGVCGDWWWEVGPAFRSEEKITVSGSSYTQIQALHGIPTPLMEPAAIGSTNAYADRIYTDGFVKLDSGTLNTNAVGGLGNTWNWDYANVGQFANDTLTFVSPSSAEGYVVGLNRTAADQRRVWAPGVSLVIGSTVKSSDRWHLDLAVGWEGTWGASSDWQMTTYRETTAKMTVTDQYDVTGIPDPGPNRGAAVGPDTPGPVIHNVPTSRTETLQTISTAQNSIHFRLDSDYYEVFFQPRVSYQATSRVMLRLSPRAGVGFLNVSASRDEVFTQTFAAGGSKTTTWPQDTDQAGRFRISAGVTAGAQVALGRGFHAGIYGGYDWVFNEVELHLGPNTVSLNGGAVVFGAVIGKSF